MAGKRKADKGGKPKGSAPKQPRTVRQRLLWCFKWAVIVGIVFALVGVAGFVYLYKTTDIPNANAEFLTETTHVYYADGKSDLGTFAIQDRDAIDYDDMPETIKDAVVAAENRTFWTDEGLDPKGIVRAFFNNASGESTQGASTITQQYVKVLYLTQERTWKRKLKEAILSLKVQNQLSKEEVLEGYLNTIYFGRGAYGIQAAARAYFDVDAKELDLRQSAVLASVLNNPYSLDPANGHDSKQALRERYEYVLAGMVDMEQVDAEKGEKAARKLPKFPKQEASDSYGGQKGHVLQMVRQELLDLGFSEDEINGGGLEVTTTFTPQAMISAENGVKAARPEGFSDKFLHIGVATVEPGTGAVRGIYGGQDYLDSQLNWAVEGGQAGSTFKPFALAAGLTDGWSLKDTFDGNSPYVLPDGSDVENQGNESYGAKVNMIKATEDSINTAYIDMTLATPNGPERIIETANAMGIPPEKTPKRDPYGFPTSTPGLEPNTGVALGSQTVSPINMANGYATIANGGVAADPYIIEKVVDREGRERYNHTVSTHEAIAEDVAADVSYAMQQVVEAGSGSTALAGFAWPAAGKTGTATNGLGEVSSAWFAGYTAQLSTAVMYVRGKGNEQLQGWLPEYFGGAYPARTWRAVMEGAMEGRDVVEFPPPAYVDGEAPSDGHAPFTPKPSPTATKPPKTLEPTEEESTEEPSESESTDEPGNGNSTNTPGPPTDEPTLPSESDSESDDSGGDSGGNGGGNGGGGIFDRQGEATTSGGSTSRRTSGRGSRRRRTAA